MKFPERKVMQLNQFFEKNKSFAEGMFLELKNKIIWIKIWSNFPVKPALK